MVLETLVYSPFNHMTRLLTQEYSIEFSRHESVNLYVCMYIYICIRPDLQPEMLQELFKVSTLSPSCGTVITVSD
jgi:hypothetical protein